MCTLSCALLLVQHTWVLTLLLLLHQILTLNSLFLLLSFFTLSSFLSLPAALLLTPPLLTSICSSSYFSLALLLSFSHSLPPSSPFRGNPSLPSYLSLFPSPLPTPPTSCFSCDRLPISSSLQRGKAVSPSPLQWPIESCWAPISLLIGWAGLSRYWEEGLALLASCLSAYLSVCLHDLLCLCSRADLTTSLTEFSNMGIWW